MPLDNRVRNTHHVSVNEVTLEEATEKMLGWAK